MSTTERDREMVREWLECGGHTESVENELADLFARVRREGHAEALKWVRVAANVSRTYRETVAVMEAVDEAERRLSKTGSGA